MIQGQCARRLCLRIDCDKNASALPWTRCIHNFQAILICLTSRSNDCNVDSHDVNVILLLVCFVAGFLLFLCLSYSAFRPRLVS